MRHLMLLLGIIFILLSLFMSTINSAHFTEKYGHTRSTSSGVCIGDALFCAFVYAAGFVSLYFRRLLGLRRFLSVIGVLFILVGLTATLLIAPLVPVPPEGAKAYTGIGGAVSCAVAYAAGFAALYFRNRLPNGE